MAITRAQQAKQLLANGGMSLQEAKDMAPKGEFLAYINNKEADMLKEAGGSGIMTAAGIPSFVEYGGESGFEGAKSTGTVGGDVDRGRETAKEVAREKSRLEAQRKADLKKEIDRLEEEKRQEKLERFRNLNSRSRKFQNLLTKVSPIAKFASLFGSLNTRDFFADKVAPPGFEDLTETQKEQVFDDYMDARNAGEIDAYGNPTNTERGEGGLNKNIAPLAMQTPTDNLEDDYYGEAGNPFENRRAFRLFNKGGIADTVVGGEFDFESARQMYGLGKLVKKVTRTVKKIAKSPVGKAALLYAGGTYLGGLKAFGGAGFGSGNFLANLKSGQGIGNLARFASGKLFGNVAYDDAIGTKTGGLLERLGLKNLSVGKAGLGIAGISALAGLMTKGDEEDEDEEQYRGEGLDIEGIRANPFAFTPRRFAAEGGDIEKEPVAKKTMPLLDMGGKEMDLREEGGFVPIGRMEKADDVPARLSKNEFVFTADAVRNAGDGDVDLGAEKMYNMMKNLEAGGDVSEESQGLEGARKMFQTSQRLEEVI